MHASAVLAPPALRLALPTTTFRSFGAVRSIEQVAPALSGLRDLETEDPSTLFGKVSRRVGEGNQEGSGETSCGN